MQNKLNAFSKQSFFPKYACFTCHRWDLNMYAHFCQFKSCVTFLALGSEKWDYPGGIQFHATDLTLASEQEASSH